MNSTRYRVAQWATGDVGKRAMREVIRHPSLDLVGVLVYNPAKAGVDAGEICGEPRTGIVATTDRSVIFGLKADCVLYMPRATGAANARAGLTISEVIDDVVTLLEAGTNIITSCTDFHAGGHPRLGAEGLARIDAACKRGKSSLYATGTDPGLVSEQIAFALLCAQRKVESVEITEYGDLSQRPSPHMIFDQMGFGKPMKDFSTERWAAHLLEEYGGPYRMLAEAAGFTVDKMSARGEVAAARQDTKIVAGEVRAGSVGAQRFIIAAHSGGTQVARLDQYAYVTRDVDPAWEIRKTGWRVRVNGDAPFDADLTFPVPLEKIGLYVPAYNANLPVNAIPYVCAAAPGILTTEDLPPIVPRGPHAKKR
jgi:2,4-diaminopentanoate dehydrogenase